MDGDRDDNSFHPLSQTGTITINTNTLTMAGALESTEIVVGDGVKVCDETFVVTAVDSVSAPTVLTVSPRATATCTAYNVMKHLETIERPNNWERWVGDYNGKGATTGAEDEGHFYMECSNRGLCDRETGVCECFPGYDGLACQRQACPNDCSGHGTCETIEQLRYSQPTDTGATCKTTQASDQVVCDIGLTGTIGLAAGDYIQIKPHPPMKVETVSDNSITLYNSFPETVPYGTPLYKVQAYKLWDSKKNRACVCDPRWTGNDCSLRKCPRGDDPLTIEETDLQNYAVSSAGLDSADYRQAVERQTLTIVSDSQLPIGHFTLTVTDYYGDQFTTMPIPTEIQLSVTASASSTTVTFDGAGLPSSELTKGDYIRLGRDYRRVTAVTYVLPSSATDGREQYIESVTVEVAVAAGMDSGAHTSGTRVYRCDVSKEIRDALEAIPNGRVPGVSVEHINRAGYYEGVVASTALPTSLASSRTAVSGDSFRIGDTIHVRGATAVPETLTDDDVVFQFDQWKYRIKFETGCNSNADCNSNGVDATDSDGSAICTLGGTCLCSDDTKYFGAGCTRSGKGLLNFEPNTHARSYKRALNGNVEPLICDKSKIYSGQVINEPAHVSRTSPTKITFDFTPTVTPAVGDLVYIDGQVRQVTAVSSNVVYVDEAFTVYDKSDDYDIVPTHTFVHLLARDGGIGISCAATDKTPLMTIKSTKSGGVGHVNTASSDREIVISDGSSTATTVQDQNEVFIGDRIRILTSSTGNYETRTVDSITYSSTGEIEKLHMDSDMITAADDQVIYIDSSGTTELSECSNRGMCDESSGVCECFTGYKYDDCSSQDSLFAA
jgi:hypothetical protein